MALIPASSLYVLDYDANCPDAAHLSRTLPVFIGILRQRHPVTPILVVSRIPTASEGWNASARQVREARAGAQRQVVDDLRSGGDGRLAFVDGGALLGEDFDETTVDGSHPTDLGFLRMADALEPTIRGLLP
jgi:hypothetical protein